MKISDDIVRNYLICKYGAFRTIQGEKPVSSEYELARMRLRAQTTIKAEAAILNHFGLPRSLPCEHVNAQVLERGLPLLLNTVLETPGFVFHFDALQRKEGESSLGLFHYVPILFSDEFTLSFA